jgi:multiple sugar transport system substrate-binding protein
VSLRGLAWDHPRAYQPLEAFAKERPSPAVSWDRQSLADFEARPVTELARQYDVMIIDHPGLGAAIAAGAIQPLRRLVPREVIEEWKATSFVPTWDSYVIGGQPWALPVDAATQVSVYRPDLLPAAPGAWAEVPALAREHRVALCLGGPHAFLAVLGMCVPGESPPDRELLPVARDLLPAARDLLPAECAVTAIELLRAIWRHADQEVSAGDPIAVHEAMAAATDLAYCPLAYGYASYARPAPGRHALRWADAPRSLRSDRPGTVLGGTGLAISALSGSGNYGSVLSETELSWAGLSGAGLSGAGLSGAGLSGSENYGPDPGEVLAFLRAFWTAEVQAGLVPDQAGQSAHVAAWDSPRVDRDWGGYYSSTRRSLAAAWIRPRDDGWIGLQERAGNLVREAVTGAADAAAVVAAINSEYRVLKGGVQ